MSSESYEIEFNLDGLYDLCPKLTPKWAEFVAEASAFCLESNNHSPNVVMVIRGEFEKTVKITWSKPHENTDATYKDLQDATEDGAVGIACGLISLLSNGKLQVIERAIKGTGFDYWVGENDSNDMFQNKSKLEVSGILVGKSRDIEYRVKQKLQQTLKSHSELKAHAVVVEFSHPITEVASHG